MQNLTGTRRRLVVFTGAGISRESGISTFRDNDGLWRNYRFEEVASPEAWERDPQLVLDFYNMRRKQLLEVEPNVAHKAIAELEDLFDVQVITQNVDDLHERAGSTKVLHLHGELRKVRSTADDRLVYTLPGWELKLGDRCEMGSQLRPNIVWFGEPVPAMMEAVAPARRAELFMVVGTSLQVWPAAGLLGYVGSAVPKVYIDPAAEAVYGIRNLAVIRENATVGVPRVAAAWRAGNCGFQG